MDYSREKQFELLKKNISTDSLFKHSFAVEAAMVAYAKKFDEDVEKWGACGLLHDIDFEKHPEEHPMIGVKMLADEGYPEDFVLAVKGHGDHTNTSRETKLAKTLYAVDELASFIVAVALVRPTKFEGLKIKSVKKKLKDKAFAKAVNREQIQTAADDLGVELSEHIQTVIDGLVYWESELNKTGLSLIK